MGSLIEAQYGRLVTCEGQVWFYDSGLGIYRPIPAADLLKTAASTEGMQVNDTGDPKDDFVTLGSGTAKDIVLCLKIETTETRFFDQPVAGIAFRDQFLRVEMSAPEPFQWCAHSPHHRARWALPVTRAEIEAAPDRFAGSYLMAYWNGLFPNDDERADKLAILQQVMAVALLGLASKLPKKQRKAIVLYETSSTGKSTFLRLVEALVPATAIEHISPAALGHEYQRAALAGKSLNTVDEIKPDAAASADFKAIVRCEPIQARVIRQEPFSFCPTALHAFGINDALAWGRAFDSGVANRLIQIAFTDPPKHPIDHIEEKISEQELPLLVAHALAGARQMHQQNWTYSRLISSEELADEQQIEGKPVHVWVAEMVSLDTSAGDVPVKAAHRAFQAWYEERKHMIRQTIPLGDRAFSRAFLSALRTVHNFDARNPRHGDARTYRGVKIGWPDTGPMLRWRREGED